jgi:transcriptional regulator with XRE-family HTH domain
MPRASMKPRMDLPKPQRDLANRMREALMAHGLTQIEAAKRASVARDLIHKAVVRGSMPREARDRDAIAKALLVSTAWLWFGTGTKEAVSGDRLTIFNFRPDPKGYTLLVEHDSFAPLVNKGDVLYVTPSYDARPGDRVFVKWDRHEGIFRLLELDGHTYILQAPNGSRVTLDASIIKEKARIAGVIFS